MSTPIGQFAFGPYTATYGGTAIGLCDGVMRLKGGHSVKPINNTSLYADSDIDGIFRGGNRYLAMTMMEWGKLATDVRKAILNPFLTLGSSVDWGMMPVCGQRATTCASEIVLTAVAGTPAYTLGPRTITAAFGVWANGNDFELLLGCEARNIPALFQCYPYVDNAGNTRWFSVTEPA